MLPFTWQRERMSPVAAPSMACFFRLNFLTPDISPDTYVTALFGSFTSCEVNTEKI